jgi:hypothetical protein
VNRAWPERTGSEERSQNGKGRQPISPVAGCRCAIADKRQPIDQRPTRSEKGREWPSRALTGGILSILFILFDPVPPGPRVPRLRAGSPVPDPGLRVVLANARVVQNRARTDEHEAVAINRSLLRSWPSHPKPTATVTFRRSGAPHCACVGSSVRACAQTSCRLSCAPPA